MWFRANAPHHVCILREGDAGQPVPFTFSEEPADAAVTTTAYFQLCSYVIIPMIPSAVAKAYKGQYFCGACRAIRHTLNPPLCFMETAIENTSGGLEIETYKCPHRDWKRLGKFCKRSLSRKEAVYSYCLLLLKVESRNFGGRHGAHWLQPRLLRFAGAF